MPEIGDMPAGGGEAGESAWAAAEKLAAAHEAELTSKGIPVPGGDAGTVQTSEAPEAKPEPAKTAAKAAAKPAAEPAADKSALIRQIEELAAKAGMKVDGNRVEVAERVAIRQERREFREQMAREKQAFQAWQQAESGKYGNHAAFEKAREANDFEGMARAAGFADWKALVGEHTKRLQSPEYREIQELKKRAQEHEAAIQADRQAQQAAQAAQQQATSIAAYKASMADEMKASGGQLESMSGDPHMIAMLYDVRAEHYKKTGEELDLHEVLDTPSNVFGGKSVLDVLEETYQNLTKIFGDRPAATDEAASAAAPRGGSSSRSREQKKPPKTVSQRNAAEASAPPTFPDTPEGEKQFKAYFAQQLNQATSIS